MEDKKLEDLLSAILDEQIKTRKLVQAYIIMQVEDKERTDEFINNIGNSKVLLDNFFKKDKP